MAGAVNSFKHGSQVGMLVEMYRNCAGFFRLLEESIESTLVERERRRDLLAGVARDGTKVAMMQLQFPPEFARGSPYEDPHGRSLLASFFISGFLWNGHAAVADHHEADPSGW